MQITSIMQKKKLRNLKVEKLRNLEVLEEIVGCTITDKPGLGREFFCILFPAPAYQ